MLVYTNGIQGARISSIGSIHFGTGNGSSADKIRANNDASDAATVTCFKGFTTGRAGNTHIDGYSHSISSSENHTNVKHFHCINKGLTGTVTNQYGFIANANLGSSNSAINNYGFYSELAHANVDGRYNFNFYATANAPNFFKGNTHIGGNASRNTRELWESTLTEEQQEQLAAGTLAIPANVSVPGDGSFARQWWYDQQSAEDQVLIDSGELEYPSHLAADTFTDTFALGENTNIDLIANTGTINLKGLSFNKGSTYPYEINYRGIYFSPTHSCPLFLGSCHTKTDTEVTVLRVVPYAYWPNDDENKNLTESTGLYIAQPIVNTGSNADSTIDEIKSLKILNIEEERISNNGTSYCIFTRQDNVSAAGSANANLLSTSTPQPTHQTSSKATPHRRRHQP